MRRLFLLSIIFSYVCTKCVAQNKKSDSLKAMLQRQKTRDTNYVNLLYSIATNLSQENNLQGAKQFSTQGIALAEKLKWDVGHIKGLLDLDRLQSLETNYDSAAATALYALNIAQGIHDESLIEQAHYSLSQDYRLMNNLTLAEYHAVKSLNAANALKNNEIILAALVNLGGIYLEKNQEDKAEEILDKALPMAIAQNNNRQLAKLLDTKAEINIKHKNFESASHYLRQGLLLWEKEKSYPWIAYTMASLSHNYNKLKRKDSASYYAYAALEVAKKKNLKRELVDAYSALFDYYNTFGDYKKALEYRLIYDTLFNEMVNNNVSQSSERTRIKLEQEKKDLMAQRDQEIKDAGARRSRNLQYGIIGGFILLAAFLFWNNRQKQKAKLKIEQAYGQLKSTQSQLIQSEKMASLGELTAGIAHEIQNPLNFVNNFSEVNKELIGELKEEIKKGNIEEVNALADDIEANEEKINHHGKRADAIVKGMLQHSRSSSGIKEPTDINALCDEYLRLSYHGLRAKDKSFNATMKTDFDNSIGKINIVPQDIGRVILNLINNAFYAVDERSRVVNSNARQAELPEKSGQVVEAGLVYEPTVSVSTKKADDKVFISVRDNGNGIPKNIVDKIFQPFFTTKSTGQGTGLGLSLAYDIIKAHGGELKVETNTTGGASFMIYLPVTN